MKSYNNTQSGEVITAVVADSLGTAMPCVIGPVCELTHLVTERLLPDAVTVPYAKLGITVIRG